MEAHGLCGLAAQGFLAAAHGFFDAPGVLAPQGLLGAQVVRAGVGLHGAPFPASLAKDGVARAPPIARAAPSVSAALLKDFMQVSEGG